jgi:hypothetical protein
MGEILPARRRWLLPAIALASVLAAVAAYVAPLHGHQAIAVPLTATRSPSVAASPSVSMSAPASASPSVSPSGPVPGAAPLLVRYGFEDSVREASAAYEVLAAAGGAVRTESHDGGLAVRFPPPCPHYGDPACPRVVLETSFAANPGTAPLRFGAAVRLAANETSDGENVLQKGFSHGHSQFKLQIDGAGGQPSCVLVGTTSQQIHVVTAGTSVANGQWHTVECVRAGASLAVFVDGAVAGRANVPVELSIVNDDPLRIGGKGTSANNDQFHGALDDIFVSIGCGVSC